MTSLEASYRDCRRLARRAASNFYYSFWLLPAEQRQGMCALYAFFRRTDDLSDNDLPADQRRRDLAAWRHALADALAGRPREPLLMALADTVDHYGVPHECLFEAVAGAEMDLQPPCFETFDELRRYCYRVASTVGLACIRIWGCRDEQAIEPAEACGVAFQLTNILRDLREDAHRGRVYLPREDLRRFGYDETALLRSEANEAFRRMMHFQIDRAEEFYRQAALLEARLAHPGRRAFRLMFATYRELLKAIRRRPEDVFIRRVRLSMWRKARLLIREGVGRLRIAETVLPNEAPPREYSAP